MDVVIILGGWGELTTTDTCELFPVTRHQKKVDDH